MVSDPASDESAGSAWNASETAVLFVAVVCSVVSQAAVSSTPKMASTVPTTSSPAWLMACQDSVVTQTMPECEYHWSSTMPWTVRSTGPMVTSSSTFSPCSSAMDSDTTTPSASGSVAPVSADDAVCSTSPESSGTPHTATEPEDSPVSRVCDMPTGTASSTPVVSAHSDWSAEVTDDSAKVGSSGASSTCALPKT